MKRFLQLALILSIGIQALAVRHHKRVPIAYHPVLKIRKHHSKWNPLFWPSRLSLLIQNKEINDNALTRYEDLDAVQDAVDRGELVDIPVSDALVIDKHLDPRRRYVRPWTAQFLTNISQQFYAEFHQPLMVDSAVRPRDVQKRLRRRNKNAAPIDGETASSHMAGLTVDLARGYMTPRMTRWMEIRLLILHIQGLVEVEEEHRQLCFHIMVAKAYPNPIPINTDVVIVTNSLELQDEGTQSKPQEAERDSDKPNTPALPASPNPGDGSLEGSRLCFPWL